MIEPANLAEGKNISNMQTISGTCVDKDPGLVVGCSVAFRQTDDADADLANSWWNGTNWTPTGPKMYAIATKSVSQTWNSTALQRVGWDSVTVDPESTISGTTTDWIFTAPRTGNYLVTFNLMFLSAWNCESWWYYYVNGVSFWNNAVAGFSTGNWWEVMQSLVVPMSAADTFYIEMKRNTGTASGTTNNSACLIQIVEM